MKVNGKLMEDGTTYYARCKTSYLDFEGKSHTTAYGPIISFVYKANKGLTGDVNGDGILDVSDVTAIISHVLGSNPQPFYIEVANTNGDDCIDVSDVTGVIAIVLNQ